MTPDDFSRYLIAAHQGLSQRGWHWFSYHFNVGPTPFATSIMTVCANIDRHTDGIGEKLFREMLNIGGIEKNESHYEQLLQKLSEILVIERIVTFSWPSETSFDHEPEAFSKGPRPELLVTFPDGRLVVEVKTPSILNHIRQRSTNSTQLPYRGLMPLETAKSHHGAGGLTLPRDYPVRDFLVDADRKFAGFRDGKTASLLVIVWDDFIYEPISTLTNQGSGLLTSNSFERDSNGQARTYANIDSIVAVRHLHYFIYGSRENILVDRTHAMDFGEGRSLPNVSFNVSNAFSVPEGLLERLRAVPNDDPGLKLFAEYNPQDIVFWL